MMTLRCTKRLLAHFSERPTAVALAAESAPLLGEWFANLIRYRNADIALCVNEVTRYAVVIPLEGCESITTLYIRLAQRVFDAMRRMGVGEDTCGRVLDEYRGGVRIANTNNRSILGTMNDLARHLEWHLDQRLRSGPVRDPSGLDHELNKIPHRSLGWTSATARLIEVCEADSS